jgi:hypothetical protein
MTIQSPIVPFASPQGAVSAAQYGVVADGVTDDGPAFTAALAALSGTGYSLWLPKSTTAYNIATAPTQPALPVNIVSASGNTFSGAGAQAIANVALVEGAAPGTAAYNPVWYSTPGSQIFIDPQNSAGTSSDQNAGTSAGTALLTYAEAVRRWGSNSPSLANNCQLVFLSSHTTAADPVIWKPYVFGGAVVSIAGAAPTTTAAVFTRTAQKSRAAGTNALLAGSFSAGAPAAAKLVANTTAGKSSHAWVYKTAGGANWDMTQPIVPIALPSSALPVEVDTWASTDTVNFLAQPAVNIVDFSPTIIEFNGGFDNVGNLSGLVVFDPNGVGADNVLLQNVSCSDVCFQRFVVPGEAAWNSSISSSFYNCFFQGGASLYGPQELTVFAGAALVEFAVTNCVATFDCDFIAGGAFSFFGGGTSGILGCVFLDANLSVTNRAQVTHENFALATHVLYGSAAKTVAVNTGSALYQFGETFTAAWTLPTLIATGAVLDGASTGNSVAYAANVATIHNGIATTVANLDAAAGAAGFGGVAFNPGAGSAISNAS